MKHIATIALVLGLLSAAAADRTTAQSQVPQFQDLFNGKDLTGWVNVNTAQDTWKVRDGLLICSGHPIGVMRSEKQYENFVLHIEWMHMEAGGNSGVFVWSNAQPDPREPPAQRRRGADAGARVAEPQQAQWRDAAHRLRARRAVRRRRREDHARQPARRAQQVDREPLPRARASGTPTTWWRSTA